MNDGKKIDAYENSVLKFLRPFIKPPNKKSEAMILATKEQTNEEDGDSIMEPAVVEDVSLNSSSTQSNNNPNPIFPISPIRDDVIDLTEKTNQNLEGRGSLDNKEADPNQPDPYEDAIAKAFTTELDRKVQCSAMLRVCKKLQNLMVPEPDA